MEQLVKAVMVRPTFYGIFMRKKIETLFLLNSAVSVKPAG